MTSISDQQSKIDKLLLLGEYDFKKGWPNYLEYGFDQSDIGELIKLATNEELYWTDDEKKSWLAPIHAWRTLAQLKAVKAIQPLIDFFEKYQDWDWAAEDLPVVMGMIGIEAIEPLKECLLSSKILEEAKITASSSLEEIAKYNPQNKEIFNQIVNILTSYLDNPNKDKLYLNATITTSLSKLNKIYQVPQETIEIIRKLYKDELADLMVTGDIEDVEIYFGIRKKRDTPKKPVDLIENLRNSLRSNTCVTSNKIGRNDPCCCGSGKKYKKCCLLGG